MLTPARTFQISLSRNMAGAGMRKSTQVYHEPIDWAGILILLAAGAVGAAAFFIAFILLFTL